MLLHARYPASCAALATLALAAGSSTVAAPPEYKISIFAPGRLTPDGEVLVTGLNASGIATGVSGSSAFRWRRGHGFVPLPDLPGGGDATSAAAIDALGNAVGSSASELGTHAAIFPRHGGVRDLNGLLPASSSNATAIGSAGHVAGDYLGIAGDGGSFAASFVWHAGTGMQRLGGPDSGAETTHAYGVNADGAVVGLRFGPNRSVGFLWTAEGGFVDLPDTASAHAINDAGQVVGTAYLPLPYGSAFVWHASTGTVLLPRAKGYNGNCVANAVNAGGQIAGWCDAIAGTGGLAARHSVLWQPKAGGGYEVTDLNAWVAPSRAYPCSGETQLVEDCAVAINDAGAIVVWVMCRDQGFVVDSDSLLLTPRGVR